MSQFIVAGTVTVDSDGSVRTQAGTTLTRPTAATGIIRYNTNLGIFEIYNGTAWVNVISIPTNVYAWGSVSNVAAANNTQYSIFSPVSIAHDRVWRELDGLAGYALGITTDGVLWAWGLGTAGAIGDGTTSSRSIPTAVAGGFTDWKKVCASFNSSTSSWTALAIRANGVMYGWGTGTKGISALGSTANTSSPQSIVGGFTDWVDVSSGDDHIIALRANGTAWGWGSASSGRLGNGSTAVASYSSPISVIGGITWRKISAGMNQSYGISANGVAYGWGYNTHGFLGVGNTTHQPSPVQLAGGFTDVINIKGGSYFGAMLIRGNGTLWSWGQNTYGSVGDGTTVSRSSPVSVIGGFTDWVDCNCIQFNTYALRANGTLWAWGRNSFGQLGDGTGGNTGASKSSPVSVLGGGLKFIKLPSASIGRTYATVAN